MPRGKSYAEEMRNERNKEPFFYRTVLLLIIIIEVYNWVIALRASVLIVGRMC